MVIFFSTGSHKKTKSALEKCSLLRLFYFVQTISDICFTKILWNYGILSTG